jgi:hypothetical protein
MCWNLFAVPRLPDVVRSSPVLVCWAFSLLLLQNAGMVQLLKPLLLDYVPVIQQTAALGLCMLANYNEKLAESLVTEGILEQLVYSLK